MKLVTFASAVAMPLSWWAILRWLDAFEYKIDIGPLPFVAAGLVQLVLAVICVAYLSLQAASANPSKVLRDE